MRSVLNAKPRSLEFMQQAIYSLRWEKGDLMVIEKD